MIIVEISDNKWDNLHCFYCIVQKFDGGKLWRMAGDQSKFFLTKLFHLNVPPMKSFNQFVKTLPCQTFAPHGICDTIVC